MRVCLYGCRCDVSSLIDVTETLVRMFGLLSLRRGDRPFEMGQDRICSDLRKRSEREDEPESLILAQSERWRHA